MTRVILTLVILILTGAAQAESWKIATLEWPPYTCSKCYRNGAAADALRKNLEKKGITVEFVFYPWVQAQKNAKNRSFVGYFPAWKEEVLSNFVASEPLFASPVVFLQRKEKPLIFDSLKDLKGKTFGVTEGYGNTAEFNSLVKDGSFKTVTVLNEESTIRRLIAGSVDGVLIDLFVANYYLKNLFSLERSRLSINPKVIENKNLYLAFNEASLPKVEVMRATVPKNGLQKYVEDYIKQRP